jgi:co-chaperonin GroES (HSP10)
MDKLIIPKTGTQKEEEIIDLTEFYSPAQDFVVTNIPKSEELMQAENAGILLTDEAQKSLSNIDSVPVHTIYLVGPDCKTAKPGDKVYVRGSGIAIPIDGTEYVQFREYDIIGTVLK